MVLQTDSVTFFLTKVIIVLNYMGVSTLKFNSSTNQFERCSKRITTLKFLWSFFLNILYFVYMNHAFSFKISDVFIVNIGGFVYFYMTVILLCSFTILNKKYDNLTISVLNDLNAFQFAMPRFKYKRPLKETLVLITMFGEGISRFIVVIIGMFSQFTSISIASTNLLFFKTSFIFIVEYVGLVNILHEGMLLLSYLVIAQYCYSFNRNFHDNFGSAFVKYQCLLEVARKQNQRFSMLFLLYIGFHFVSTFMWVITLYCSLHDNQRTNIEILGLLFTFWKLLLIIVIPSESMKKVPDSSYFSRGVKDKICRLRK
jgi:hypothetical protein